jgi:hypothetical protein
MKFFYVNKIMELLNFINNKNNLFFSFHQNILHYLHMRFNKFYILLAMSQSCEL